MGANRKWLARAGNRDFAGGSGRASQERAERVSGSDLSDADIAVLVNYATIVEVDRRTCEYFRQIARAEPRFANCLQRVVRSSDYTKLLDHPALA
jgi:hypothetical protein